MKKSPLMHQRETLLLIRDLLDQQKSCLCASYVDTGKRKDRNDDSTQERRGQHKQARLENGKEPQEEPSLEYLQQTLKSLQDKLQKVLDAIECSICCDPVTDSVILPCGHTFCRPCVHKWVTTENANRRKCATCRGQFDYRKVTRNIAMDKIKGILVPTAPPSLQQDDHDPLRFMVQGDAMRLLCISPDGSLLCLASAASLALVCWMPTDVVRVPIMNVVAAAFDRKKFELKLITDKDGKAEPEVLDLASKTLVGPADADTETEHWKTWPRPTMGMLAHVPFEEMSGVLEPIPAS